MFYVFQVTGNNIKGFKSVLKYYYNYSSMRIILTILYVHIALVYIDTHAI